MSIGLLPSFIYSTAFPSFAEGPPRFLSNVSPFPDEDFEAPAQKPNAKMYPNKKRAQPTGSARGQNQTRTTASPSKSDAINGTPDRAESASPRNAKPITVYEDEDTSASSAFESPKEGQVPVIATISVPHTKDPLAKVVAYPWTMKPPLRNSLPNPLPEENGLLRMQILNEGYMNRVSGDLPYPQGGWRWQYAFRRGLEKSNTSVPHTIAEHYLWADKMLEYVKPEAIRINKEEKAREARYQKAVQEYDDNRSVIEAEAIKRGLAPKLFKRTYARSKKIGSNYASNLEKGKWWILGTHKVKGLKYYWLLPVDIDKESRIVLNESNAIYIEGGW